jgi:hypothetical protein
MNEQIWFTPGLLMIAFGDDVPDVAIEKIFAGADHRRFGKSVVIAFGHLTQFNMKIVEVLGELNVIIKPFPYPEGFTWVSDELSSWMIDLSMASLKLSGECKQRIAREESARKR